MTEEETTETQEEIPVLATGLSIAFGYSDAPDPEPGSRRRGGPDRFADLRQWQPKTRLGRMVMNGEILNYNQAMATGLPICLLYTSPSPRDAESSRMPSSA